MATIEYQVNEYGELLPPLKAWVGSILEACALPVADSPGSITRAKASISKLRRDFKFELEILYYDGHELVTDTFTREFKLPVERHQPALPYSDHSLR